MGTVPRCTKAFNRGLLEEKRNKFETQGLWDWLGWDVL